MTRLFALLIAALALSACATTNPASYSLSRQLAFETNGAGTVAPTNAVVMIDGTANDQTSRTNLSRLFHLIAERDDPTTDIFYTEGVGTDGRIIGAITGLGHSRDIRDAYRYLTRTGLNEKTNIFLFGYSRGGYSIRALNGLIAIAGIADTSALSVSDSKAFTSDLYAAYKGLYASAPEEENYKNSIRRAEIDRVFAEWEFRGVKRRAIHRVRLIGLWDVVEALGLADFAQNVGEVNKRYVDTLCNVDRALHAVALDDNRARIYTPILMTEPHLVSGCDKDIDIDERVQEVWFPGAHADIGGGYKEGLLSGVSMNWMLSEIEKHLANNMHQRKDLLFPANSRVTEEPFDIVHNAEGANLIYKIAFRNQSRNIYKYVKDNGYNGGRLKIHHTAIERLHPTNQTKVNKIRAYRNAQDSHNRGKKFKESKRFIQSGPMSNILFTGDPNRTELSDPNAPELCFHTKGDGIVQNKKRNCFDIIKPRKKR